MSPSASPPGGRRPRFTARHLPPVDDPGGWLATAPPLAFEAPRLDRDLEADCVVVGAGFTGLAAARRCAELRPEWSLAVLDAGQVGSGASGRSSGFVVDLAGFIAAMPPDLSERFIRLSRAGIAELESVVCRHQISCDWDSSGFFHVAAGESGLQALQGLETWLRSRGEALERYDATALAQTFGTRFYRAGLRMPGSVMVQAGSLVRGLADHLPGNVSLFEGSAVRAIETGEPHTLHTERATLRTPRVLVALNAYSPDLGILRRRVFPLLTYGSLTRPLRAAEREALGGESTWGLLAQDPVGSSLRRTADQRLLIRNTLRYASDLRTSEGRLRRYRQIHYRTLLARFPQLPDLEIEHTWAGAMGISPNQYPFFGELAPGILSSGGFTGAGIAMGTICGCLLAEKLIGQPSDLLTDLEALPGPKWLPPEPFLGLGIRFRVARMNASAGASL